MADYAAQTEKFPASPISADVKISPILQRVAEADKAAVKSCIDAYGSLVWAVAKNILTRLKRQKRRRRKFFSIFGNMPVAATLLKLKKEHLLY